MRDIPGCHESQGGGLLIMGLGFDGVGTCTPPSMSSGRRPTRSTSSSDTMVPTTIVPPTCPPQFWLPLLGPFLPEPRSAYCAHGARSCADNTELALLSLSSWCTWVCGALQLTQLYGIALDVALMPE